MKSLSTPLPRFPSLMKKAMKNSCGLTRIGSKVRKGRKNGGNSLISEWALLTVPGGAFSRDMWILTKCDGRYETKVKDFNFGSLIRTDARKEYSETNTIFGRF